MHSRSVRTSGCSLGGAIVLLHRAGRRKDECGREDCFKSMEDLVNEFDEKLNVCFRNYNAKTENLAPVKNQLQIQEEEETLQDEEVWDALTDNYIPSLSEDWRDPNIEALNGNNSDTEIHEKEEEEFNEKSENDSGINEEPLLTADQVIEEIEEMMQNSPDPEEEEEEVLEEDDGGEISSQADSVLLQEMQALTQTFNNNWSYEGLRHMSGSELTELLDQVEGAIRDFSEELVHQLARRDELEFEKEVKNSFITVLIEVQNKQKEQRELMKKRRKEKGLSLQSSRIEKGNQMPLKRFSMEGISNILQSGIRQTFGSSGADRQYLNTVIPYEKKSSPPSVEDLQMLTNILFAMKEDNEKVPTLLTDYILKDDSPLQPLPCAWWWLSALCDPRMTSILFSFQCSARPNLTFGAASLQEVTEQESHSITGIA
ncbi:fasciculation and elongation protein zeta 1 (zygin I) [Cricetulus griseus]